MQLRSFLSVALTILGGLLYAVEPPAPKKAQKSVLQSLAEGCAPATAQADLNINNVRARILGGGDMWWDLNDAQYEVPKGSNKHAMFAGALWLGGIDDADQLKLAAMTYRQRGVDFWPGPLDDDASITEQTCQDYDRQWTVYRSEVEIHKAWIDCKEDPDCSVEERFPGYAGEIPQSILEWPGNGLNAELPYMLAPFFESDTNGIPGFYEPDWDYPAYDFSRELDCQARDIDLLYGDQTIWWVYNDKGNIHTETQGAALGFEIRAQAFSFTANDEINNMTFNNYRILNRSTFRLKDTYFGTWFDADLGNPFDDIIGCDIPRGLGYVYNADNPDSGPLGYGFNPPAIGFDFFQGPFADYFNGLDDDRDGCVDAVRREGVCVPENPALGINERIIMSGFMYYNNRSNFNGPQGTTDPANAQEFYNYLRNRWKDGRNLVIENPSGPGNTSNGDGYVLNESGFTRTNFAYPGSSFDTTGNFEPSAPTNWYESPDNRADKRGLHNAGPFSLAPGALNFITTGAVWARDLANSDLFASVNAVIVADDKAQQLFDNCFQVLDGPNAPDVEIVELDGELILNFIDPYNEQTIGYEQIDPRIPPRPNWTQTQIDSAMEEGYFTYRFEGFQIFQVANSNVGVDDLYDVTLSRLIAQSDLKNGITQLVNYTESPDLAGNPLMPQDMTLQAADNGIQVSYHLREDAFAEGDRRLINNREYYYYVIAYSQNNYAPFRPLEQEDGVDAQKTPFLAGRRNIGRNSKPYVGIPSRTENRFDGTRLNSRWGDEAAVTRLSGTGNGGAYLKVTSETEDLIVRNFFQQELDYLSGFSPVQLSVTDPFKVRDGRYRLEVIDLDTARFWELYDESTNELLAEDQIGIDVDAEQILNNFGFSVSMNNALAPGFAKEGLSNNGIVGASVIYSDPTKPWLTGLPDTDAENPTNWILAGSNRAGTTPPGSHYGDHTFGDNNVDPEGDFETILGGTWAPVSMTSDVPLRGVDDSPGFPIRSGGFSAMYPIEDLPSIDVVITPDPSKWTRVPVIEMGNDQAANDGQVQTFRLRSGNTLNLVNGELVEDPSSTGWSYFPGYAIDVEKGVRLNMVIGENSWLKSENGGDMLWNPTANLTQRFGLGGFAAGGMHVVYVMADTSRVFGDLTYKGDDIDQWPLKSRVETQGFGSLTFGALTWCSVGMLTSNEYIFEDYSQIPTEARVELRMSSPYKASRRGINEGRPTYRFDLDGFQARKEDRNIANDALANIRVVPNPYYGASQYETSQLDNRVKITNLPRRCEINIFMTNGTLVRTIQKDNSLTFAEWDLKNEFNVPIASGIYLIHVDAGPIGQTVLKWMGSLRPVDLNAF